MSNGINNNTLSTQNWRTFGETFEDKTKAIAQLAFGSGIGEGERGGKGHIGLVGDKVIKFNTKSSERSKLSKLGTDNIAYKDMKESCDGLRKELGALVASSEVKFTDENAKKSLLAKLGVTCTDGGVSVNADAGLLERTTAAEVLKELVAARQARVADQQAKEKAAVENLVKTLWDGHQPTYGSSVDSFKKAVEANNTEVFKTYNQAFNMLVGRALRGGGANKVDSVLHKEIGDNIGDYCKNIKTWLDRTCNFMLGLVPTKSQNAEAYKNLKSILDNGKNKIESLIDKYGNVLKKEANVKKNEENLEAKLNTDEEIPSRIVKAQKEHDAKIGKVRSLLEAFHGKYEKRFDGYTRATNFNAEIDWFKGQKAELLAEIKNQYGDGDAYAGIKRQLEAYVEDYEMCCTLKKNEGVYKIQLENAIAGLKRIPNLIKLLGDQKFGDQNYLGKWAADDKAKIPNKIKDARREELRKEMKKAGISFTSVFSTMKNEANETVFEGTKLKRATFVDFMEEGIDRIKKEFSKMLADAHKVCFGGKKYPDFGIPVDEKDVPEEFLDVFRSIKSTVDTFKEGLDSIKKLPQTVLEVSENQFSFNDWHVSVVQGINPKKREFDEALGVNPQGDETNRFTLLKNLADNPPPDTKTLQKLFSALQGMQNKVYNTTVENENSVNRGNGRNYIHDLFNWQELPNTRKYLVSSITDVKSFKSFITSMVTMSRNSRSIFNRKQGGERLKNPAIPQNLIPGPLLKHVADDLKSENSEQVNLRGWGTMVTTSLPFFERLRDVALAFGVIKEDGSLV